MFVFKFTFHLKNLALNWNSECHEWNFFFYNISSVFLKKISIEGLLKFIQSLQLYKNFTFLVQS